MRSNKYLLNDVVVEEKWWSGWLLSLEKGME